MIKYFAWEHSFSGPVASIWYDKQTDGNGKDRKTLGNIVALADDDSRTLDELKLAYPIEVKE